MIKVPALDGLTRTKTIATVGPASWERQQLVELIRAGVDVFRLNMAHGTRAEHDQVIEDIRAAAEQAEQQVGILVDLAGPKIRLGQLHTDPIYFEPGSQVEFVRGEVAHAPRQLVCSYERLVDEVEVGDAIILSDGMVRLRVLRRDDQSAVCEVIDGGEIRSRQGVNLPGVKLQVAVLGEIDRDNARWAIQRQADFLSLSFVRRADDIRELKAIVERQEFQPFVIAKIEKSEALDDLEAIVRASDGIMVARGDLGVEIRIEKTPMAQKRIIKTCQRLGKPVIVATQMLESMHHSRQPTRAEASDVANAILDGADACMLSGETAIGDYPRESVEMMQRIMRETEQALIGRPSRLVGEELIKQQGISEAVVYGAAQIARRVQAKLVMIATARGTAALVKSKQRDFIPTIAVTDRSSAARRMTLFWGITPAFCSGSVCPDPSNPSQLIKLADQWAESDPVLNRGDRVILVMDTAGWPGNYNTVIVAQIGDSET